MANVALGEVSGHSTIYLKPRPIRSIPTIVIAAAISP